MTSQIVRVQSKFKNSILDQQDNYFYVVIILVPTPSFVSLRSSEGNFIEIIGSDVILTCSLELNPTILGSEIFMLTVETQLFRDGVQVALDGPIVVGTTFTYTTQLNAFGRNNFGNYNCTATIRPQPSLTHLIGTDVLSDILSIITGKLVLLDYSQWDEQYFLKYAVIPPPIDIRATQSNSSTPVGVSWSPPIEYGLFNITGYRIFYGNGQNVLVPSVMIITSVGLKVNESYDGQTVFLRSESAQTYSEIVNVTVGKLLM